MDPTSAHGELVVALEATPLDIGLAGLAIETDTRLAPQRAVRLVIRERRGEIAVRGRVVWCFFHGTSEGGSGETLPVYRTGIEFTDVLTPVAESLVRFLESHALVDGGETRLFGRFRLGDASSVRVELDSPFRLTGIGAGEAAVESPLAVEAPPGARVRLAPGDGGPSVTGHLTDLVRSEERRDLWRLRLALDQPVEAEPRLRALLEARGAG
jgi:hypothetical protein